MPNAYGFGKQELPARDTAVVSTKSALKNCALSILQLDESPTALRMIKVGNGFFGTVELLTCRQELTETQGAVRTQGAMPRRSTLHF